MHAPDMVSKLSVTVTDLALMSIEGPSPSHDQEEVQGLRNQVEQVASAPYWNTLNQLLILKHC